MINEQIIKRVLYQYLDEKEQKKFKKPRKYSKSYCKSTPCSEMGSLRRLPVVRTKIVISKFAFFVFFTIINLC